MPRRTAWVEALKRLRTIGLSHLGVSSLSRLFVLIISKTLQKIKNQPHIDRFALTLMGKYT
jgi:hypothetical protein